MGNATTKKGHLRRAVYLVVNSKGSFVGVTPMSTKTEAAAAADTLKTNFPDMDFFVHWYEVVGDPKLRKPVYKGKDQTVSKQGCGVCSK